MKHFITILLCLIVPVVLCAQRRGDVSRELLEYKIKYLAQEMDLKSDQQTKFVELYTRMSNEKHQAFKSAIELERRVRNDKNASSEDYQRASDAMAQAKIKEGEIEKKYDAEFKKFLTAKQIYKMKEAEGTFREKLRELRAKKGKR